MRVNNWLSGFACVLLLGVVGCKKDKIREGIPVVVEKVGVDDVEIFGDYVGRIRARQFVEVHARVEGYLEKMLFEEGKRVERNQPLFIINPDLYKARADKAAAQLKKDEAQELKTGRDVERLRPLYEQNAASQLDLDNAIAAYESAKANVAMSKADLAQAEMELGYTTVRSPISGYISERHADYLRSQQRNVRLGEQDATRSWQPSITVTLADNSVYPEKGLVDFAEPQVDPKTGTFGVRAELANPGRKLLPGQFTKVKLLLDVRENAVVVPARAIIIEKGGAHVYVMRRDSTAEKRFIETGPEVGNFVVVERGLGPDEMVVTEGQHKLSPGDLLAPRTVAKKEENTDEINEVR